MIGLLVMALIAAPIILIVESRSRQKNVQNDEGYDAFNDDNGAEIDEINQEILKEMNKKEPDYNRLKSLHSRLDELKSMPNIREQWQKELKKQGDTTVLSKSGNKAIPKHSLNGIEVALFMGSLLILVGVGGLVSSGLNEMGLGLLILATLGFYVGGISLRKKESFKIVSQVLVGTGMAMLPFIGLLIHNITKFEPNLIWLIMSIIGIPVYFYATYIMNNKVFSFAAIIAIASMSCSLTSVIGLGMVWYFALLMIIGIIMDCMKTFKIPRELGVMQEAITVTGEWMPLAAFFASLFAANSISVTSYLLLLSIIVAQLSLNFWHSKYNTWWETALRVAAAAWIILLFFSINQTVQWVGLGIFISSTCVLFASMIIMTVLPQPNKERVAIEAGWIIVAMAGYPLSGLFINEFDSNDVWVGLLAGLLIDTAIMLVARWRFKMREFYYAIIAIGIFLPIALINLLNIPPDNRIFFIAPCYMGCMFLLEGIGWLCKKEGEGDSMLTAGAVIFGLATVIAKPIPYTFAAVLLLVSVAFAVRGWIKKRYRFAEASIYLLAGSIASMVIANEFNLSFASVTTILAHIVFLSLIITSTIWEKKVKMAPTTNSRKRDSKPRLLIGCIFLLVSISIAALISGETWVMILFMVEALIILIGGLAAKYQMIWITGAIALFLAVMWFTRGLPFVWPVVLGVGLIGAVIGIILYNDKKKKH